MCYLPLIPIKGSPQQNLLPLDEVYVPLRIVEREQIEQFRKLTVGDFDEAGEFQRREEAFAAVESTQRVYRLLSDPQAFPAAEDDHDTRSKRRVRRHESDAPELPFTTNRLLLIGDAGSGKTTTLHYGALILAADLLAASQNAARSKLDLFTPRPLLPFYIRLTLVAAYVRECHRRERPAELPRLDDAPADLLLEWFDAYLYAQSGKTIPANFATRALAAGDCIVLLDGLDETGDSAARDYMQRLITNLAGDSRYRANRFLIASRPFEGLALPGFSERHLSPLDDDEITLLLTNWFGAIRRYDSSRRATESVEQQVGYLARVLSDNPRLFEMATNPLLLTTMALLVHHGDELPRERAEIYYRLIPLLLKKWREVQIGGGKPGGSESSAPLYEESESSVQRRLQELAAAMQVQQRREIRPREAQEILRPIYRELMGWNDEQADDHSARLLESLALHSGLIQARDIGFSFTHYTLQEYLTARAYDLRPNGVELLIAQRDEGRWRETIRLAVGHWATNGQPQKARQLLRALLDAHDIDALLLAATALNDADAPRVPELRALQDDTITRLQTVAFDPQLLANPAKRNRAATLLDIFDADTRPGLDPRAEDYWATPIPVGPFVLGDDNGEYDSEKPAFVYTITQPYQLARFPVTNRQYAEFLATLPAEAANQRRPSEWPGASFRPGEGNHPVVGISWRDATTFATWVDASRGVIGLPTEPEWERAAAYPVDLPVVAPGFGRRTYAWGELPMPADEPDSGLTSSPTNDTFPVIPANIAETTIGGTSVVGIFPHGAAACGACDITGNVWEWCSTPYMPYAEIANKGFLLPETLDKTLGKKTDGREQTYVLRGGSWNVYRSLARCAFRLGNHPGDRDDRVGVRLARRLHA